MLDATAQLAKRPGALLFGFASPLFEPAGLGPITIPRCEPGRVRHQPDEHEVRKQLAGEDRFEIELEKGLARQRLVVPQDAQTKPVRDDCPKMRLAAIEEFLHQSMGIDGRCAALPGSPAVERQATAN